MIKDVKRDESVKISIIIVTYNSGEEIKTCLYSVIQSVKNITSQIILIDNNSQDNTKKILKNFLQQFNSLQLVENETNYGFTKAVNQGLRLAKGEYILLLNPDTELPADLFTKLLPLFEKDSSVGILSPQFRNRDQTIQPSCRSFPKHQDILYHVFGLNLLLPNSKVFNHWKMGDFDHQTECFVDQPQGAFLLTTRKAYDDVGLLDESFPMFFSDVDWCRRFIEKGWKILFTPEAQITHLKGTSIHKNRIPLIWSSHISFYHYFKKYYKKGLWPLLNFLILILLIKLAMIRILIEFFSKKTKK